MPHMGGFFSRHASVRQFVATWFLVGVALGIQTRGWWTSDRELMRFGVYALFAGSLLLVGLLAALPVRWIPRMWHEESASLVERTSLLAACLGGIALAVVCLWLSPWSDIATATALMAATAFVVAVLFVSSRNVPR